MLLVILTAAYLLPSLYVVLRLMHHIRRIVIKKKKARIINTIVALLFAAVTFFPILGTFLPLSDMQRFFREWGNVWFGVVIFLGVFTVIEHIISLIADIVTKKKRRNKRSKYSDGKRFNSIILCLVIVLTVLLSAFAMVTAKTPVRTAYAVALEKKSATVTHLKAVLIGDLHISLNSSLSHIEKTVRMINDENPDVVLIAGDIMTSCYTDIKDPEAYAGALSGIRSKYGTYTVFGNHDVEETLFFGFGMSEGVYRPDGIVQFLRDSNITVLEDEIIELGDTGVQILGRLDGEYSGKENGRDSITDLVKKTDYEKPLLILEHEPWDFDEPAENGVGLVMAGHTHNGQLFPGNIAVKYFNDNGYGLLKIADTQTVVTSGVGFFGPPMRLGTKSEVAVIDINFE